MLNLASRRSSPDRSTKSTRSHLRAPTACGHRVSGSLSLPSRGPFHLSFTVLFSIGHWVVFSLTGWSPLFPTGFPVSRGTLDSCCAPGNFGYGAFTLFGRSFQFRSPVSLRVAYAVRTPPCPHGGLGSSGSARRYSRNRCFFLFLRLLRCFSSPGSPPWAMDSPMDTRSPSVWVSPFRHPRIAGYLLLPAAFRSLSRLSSAPSARASALRPFLLNLSCLPASRRPASQFSSLRCIALQRLLFFLLVLVSSYVRCLFIVLDLQYSVFKVRPPPGFCLPASPGGAWA